MSHTFAVMWDCDGLEAVVDITDLEHQRTFAMLKGIERPPYQIPNLLHWRLRAQANPQRHYEIYVLQVEAGITEDDVREAFEVNPQQIVDVIRQNGHKFYSNRYEPEKRAII